MNLKSIFAAEMARQVGDRNDGGKFTPIRVADRTRLEDKIKLRATRAQWERAIAEFDALCAVARAADDLRYGVGRVSDGIMEQRLDNSLRALEAIRAGGAA